MRIVSEQEFHAKASAILSAETDDLDIGCVTGPGRSGAVAAVYASHLLGIPFIPYGSKAPTHLGRLLIVDTAMESGATMRKAARRYAYADPLPIALYQEPPRVAFWYESGKPQFYRHELRERDSVRAA